MRISRLELGLQCLQGSASGSEAFLLREQGSLTLSTGAEVFNEHLLQLL